MRFTILPVKVRWCFFFLSRILQAQNFCSLLSNPTQHRNIGGILLYQWFRGVLKAILNFFIFSSGQFKVGMEAKRKKKGQRIEMKPGVLQSLCALTTRPLRCPYPYFYTFKWLCGKPKWIMCQTVQEWPTKAAALYSFLACFTACTFTVFTVQPSVYEKRLWYTHCTLPAQHTDKVSH